MSKRSYQVTDALALIPVNDVLAIIQQTVQNSLKDELEKIRFNDNENRLVTTVEASELIGVSRPTFEKLVVEKCIPRIPHGRRAYRFRYSDIKKHIRATSIL
ncbi:helix-turn-helix transcriptional regulator [Pollutibacter soli]|uniref:helix-turn-helix transcriptional regulator n=1 Tax=Pollutibacter soli TaxID=3034157 RepID=UPI003013A7B1